MVAVSGILCFGAVSGLLSDRERGTVEMMALVSIAVIATGLVVLGSVIALIRRECAIDTDADSVETGWYLLRGIHVRRERLSDFGAITLKSVSGSAHVNGHRSRDVVFQVCLIRGTHDEALPVACCEPTKPNSDLDPTAWRSMMGRLLIITSIREEVETARRTAAEIARMTRLPYGHPTLGQDATDPNMQPLHLPDELCLSCAARAAGTPRNTTRA